MRSRWPTTAETAAAFGEVGFEVVELRDVEEVSAVDLADYWQRIAVGADSTLTMISDADFEVGLEQLRTDALENPGDPVVGGFGLIVLV